MRMSMTNENKNIENQKEENIKNTQNTKNIENLNEEIAKLKEDLKKKEKKLLRDQIHLTKIKEENAVLNKIKRSLESEIFVN